MTVYASVALTSTSFSPFGGSGATSPLIARPSTVSETVLPGTGRDTSMSNNTASVGLNVLIFTSRIYLPLVMRNWGEAVD